MAETKEGGESEAAVAPAPRMAAWVVPVAVALIGAVTTISVALINRPSASAGAAAPAASPTPPPSPTPPASPTAAASQTAAPAQTEAPGAEQLLGSQPMNNGRYLSRWRVTTGATHPEDVDVRVEGDTNILDFMARGPMGKQLYLDASPGAAASSHRVVKAAPRVFEVSIQAEGKAPLRLSAVPQ